jgi:hypothetical protein
MIDLPVPTECRDTVKQLAESYVVRDFVVWDVDGTRLAPEAIKSKLPRALVECYFGIEHRSFGGTDSFSGTKFHLQFPLIRHLISFSQESSTKSSSSVQPNLNLRVHSSRLLQRPSHSEHQSCPLNRSMLKSSAQSVTSPRRSLRPDLPMFFRVRNI